MSPARAWVAPVKAPRSCPNSSDSISGSGSAAQLIARNGPAARGEASWMKRAITSLPVPGLAVEQHGRVGRGDLRGLGDGLAPGGRHADHAARRPASEDGQFVGQRSDALLERRRPFAHFGGARGLVGQILCASVKRDVRGHARGDGRIALGEARHAACDMKFRPPKV